MKKKMITPKKPKVKELPNFGKMPVKPMKGKAPKAKGGKW